MRHFGLTGFPLEHSFSPRYFNNKFRQEGLSDCKYELYPVTTANVIRDLFEADKQLEGLSVTIPWKQEVIGILDELDDSATEAGAVNVVRAKWCDGRLNLRGYNTDVYGFMASLPEGFKRSNVRAIVLGSGGASAAVACALQKLEIDHIVVSRRAGQGTILYSELTSKIIEESQLVVNATPLGMFPDTESKPDIDYNSLSSDTLLYDLVYNPPVKKFMEEGIRRGCRVMNGQRMLELQADRAWEIWNVPVS